MNIRLLNWLLAILLLFFVVTNVFPDILVLIAFATLGLAIPLFYVNTITLYLLVAWPVLFLLNRTPRNWLAIGLAAMLLPLVAFGPPLLAHSVVTWKTERLRAEDMRGTFAESPRSVEILRRRQRTEPYDPPTDTPCEMLCQRLLLSGRVEVVRVTGVVASDPVPRGRRDYVAERRPSCPSGVMLAETIDAAGTAICFIERDPGPAEIAVRIVVGEPSFPNRPIEPQDLREDIAAGAVTNAWRMEMFASTPTAWTLRLRQTQVTVSQWVMPLYLTFASCRGFCAGKPVFGRTSRQVNEFDHVALALQVLHLDGERPQPRLEPADQVVAVLDHATGPLTRAQAGVVRGWAFGLWTYNPLRPLTGKEETLLLRVVQDRRIDEFKEIAGIFNQRRLAAAHLDVILDEMEARGVNSPFSNAMGGTLASTDIQAVQARRDRVLAILRARDWSSGKHDIAAVAGRLGIDTTDLIAEKLKSPNSAQGAAQAACLADESIGRALVPHLLAYLRARPVTDLPPSLAAGTAIKTLGRLGHATETREIVLQRYPEAGADYLQRLQSSEARNLSSCD